MRADELIAVDIMVISCVTTAV